MKRPAASDSEVGKAAPTFDLSGLFAKLRARKDKVNRASFTSQAYHNARVMAERAGYSEADAGAIGRQAYKDAGNIYDNE